MVVERNLESPGRRARALVLCVTVLLGALAGAPDARADAAALWDALRDGGHVALLRHALAPGTGDPAGFTIGACATQRTLSDEGRDQARRIGARFRAHGIAAAAILSSQWCRCAETAELLDLGPVRELPALNSFFQRWQNRDPQTDALRDWLGRQDLARPHVLVTHQVNITALTGVTPRSGELVVVRVGDGGAVETVGRIATR